jgi:hypothetical protein
MHEGPVTNDQILYAQALQIAILLSRGSKYEKVFTNRIS